jgi:hypothetical protein
MKQLKQLLFVLFVVQSMFSATGCSILGFGIGAVKDAKKIEKIKKYGIPSEQSARSSVQENKRIQIFLKNGNRLDGKFIKLVNEKVDDEIQHSILWHDMSNNQQVTTQFIDIERIITIEYEEDKWAGLEEAGTIKGSSHIEIFLKDGQKLEARFLKQMEQKIGNDTVTTIEWNDVANKRQVSTQVTAIEGIIAFENEQDNWVDIEEAASIKAKSRIEIFLKDGQLLKGRFLKQMEQQVGNETVEAIEWYDEANIRQMSTQAAGIEGIVVTQKRNGKWKGLGIGLILDAALTGAILKNGLDIGLDGFSLGYNFGF